ncbi:MAG: hypothetical protein QME60_00675 [Verrucomicrobiota bacterium]|nr:hypothetical protein [Verrucomicrobiota bacterium]
MADKPDFSRYQIILDRLPFGHSAPAQPPVKNEPSFISFLRMVAIVDEPDGARVGFVRIGRPRESAPGVAAAAQVQSFFYLCVGETSDQGELLVEVNKEQERAILRKGDEQQAISMGSANSADATATFAGARFGTAAVPPGAGAKTITWTGISAPTVPAPGSYADRLRQRREARERRNAELMAAATNPARPSAETIEKHLREYNLNLIRQKGEAGPPLPIALTAEEDAQLVLEGVLPPQQ